MTSHEERAREWLHDHGVKALPQDLAAEFAAVEAEAQKDTLALLERSVEAGVQAEIATPTGGGPVDCANIAKRVWDEGR